MADLKFSELPEAGSLAGNDVLALETAGGASSKITGANLLAGGVGSILVDSTNLSSAQLLDLQNTSVELLPAPGGRLYYVPVAFVLHYRFVTTPYAENQRNNLTIGFGANLAEISSTGILCNPLVISAAVGDLFKNTEDAYIMPPITFDQSTASSNYWWTASALEDKALGICIDSFGVPLTGGDGTLTVRTFYSLIDGLRDRSF